MSSSAVYRIIRLFLSDIVQVKTPLRCLIIKNYSIFCKGKNNILTDFSIMIAIAGLQNYCKLQA
jgi:hypothetical protein